MQSKAPLGLGGVRALTRVVLGVGAALWFGLAVDVGLVLLRISNRPGEAEYGRALSRAENRAYNVLGPAAFLASTASLILVAVLVALYSTERRRRGDRSPHPIPAVLFVFVPGLNPILLQRVFDEIAGRRPTWRPGLVTVAMALIGTGTGTLAAAIWRWPNVGSTVDDTRLMGLVLGLVFAQWSAGLLCAERAVAGLPQLTRRAPAPVGAATIVLATCALSAAIVLPAHNRSQVSSHESVVDEIAFTQFDWTPSNAEVECLNAEIVGAEFSAADLQSIFEPSTYSDETLRSLARAALVCDQPGGIRDDVIDYAIETDTSGTYHDTGMSACLDRLLVGETWVEFYVQINRLELAGAAQAFSQCLEISPDPIETVMAASTAAADASDEEPDVSDSGKLYLINFPDAKAQVLASPSWNGGTMVVAVGYGADSIDLVRPLFGAAIEATPARTELTGLDRAIFVDEVREATVGIYRVCGFATTDDRRGYVVQPEAIACSANPTWK